MRLRLLDEPDVTLDEDAAIRAGLCRCFPPDVEIFSQTRSWHGSRPAFSLVTEEGREIVAHAGIVDREIRVGGKPVRVAGVQNVYVLPEYRGRGLFRQVMAAAMDEARQRGLEFGLLFCTPDIGAKYSRLEWHTLDERTIARIDEQGLPCPLPEKNVTMYLPLAGRPFPPGDIHLMGNDW